MLSFFTYIISHHVKKSIIFILNGIEEWNVIISGTKEWSITISLRVEDNLWREWNIINGTKVWSITDP